MANVVLTTEIFKERLDGIFDEIYSQHGHIEYRLEQCGKLYRVKRTLWGNNLRPEYKTGWLPLKEAQGILKLLKGNEENE